MVFCHTFNLKFTKNYIYIYIYIYYKHYDNKLPKNKRLPNKHLNIENFKTYFNRPYYLIKIFNETLNDYWVWSHLLAFMYIAKSILMEKLKLL